MATSNPVYDKYDVQAQIQIKIYLGKLFLENTNTNTFWLTFFFANTNMNILESLFLDKLEYKYFVFTKNGQIQLQIPLF